MRCYGLCACGFLQSAELPQVTPLSGSEIRATLQNFGPVIRFHPDDPYLPASVEWYLQHAVHYAVRDGECVSEGPALVPDDGELRYTKLFTVEESEADFLALTGTFTASLLGKSGAALAASNAECDAVMDSAVFRGAPDSAVVYVSVKWQPGSPTTDLQFWFFCPMNGPGFVSLGGYRHAFTRQGRHQGDWEHFTMRVSNVGEWRGRPVGLVLSAHGKWSWLPLHCPLDATEWHPDVFPSLHGHGTFASAGVHYSDRRDVVGRLVFAVENHTGDTGFALPCATRHVLIHCNYDNTLAAEDVVAPVVPEWFKYRGRWGPVEAHDVKAAAQELVESVLPWAMRAIMQPLVALILLKTNNGPTSICTKPAFLTVQLPEQGTTLPGPPQAVVFAEATAAVASAVAMAGEVHEQESTASAAVESKQEGARSEPQQAALSPVSAAADGSSSASPASPDIDTADVAVPPSAAE